MTRLTYLSPSILLVRFKPVQPFTFIPGQFLTIEIPGNLKSVNKVKRCYSFAVNPEASTRSGYEICVKLVPGGKGSEFLRSLLVGDQFKAVAPFGDFKLPLQTTRKNLCLISTGTGIGPFRSMLGSSELLACGYESIHLLHGVRFENDLIFAAEFQRAGVNAQFIVSQPSPVWAGSKGRVTDLLQSLPRTFPFSDTDFFICGNGNMVNDVFDRLVNVRRVTLSSITREIFTEVKKKKAA